MGKKIGIDDRAVHKVQAYLTKKEYSDLEKFCLKKKRPISSIVAEIIVTSLQNPSRTSGVKDKL